MEYKGKNLNADYLQSTFWWDMFLKPGTRKDKAGKDLKMMRGYSKFNNEAEAMSSAKCFCSKVTMLERCNYIKDSEKIEIHKRVDFICKMDDPIYITLYQDRYMIPPDQFAKFNPEILQFLKNLYKARSTGQPHHPKFAMIPPVLNSKDEMLKKTGWSNWQDIYKYGEKLKAQGFETGAVSGYVFREMERLQSLGRI